MEKQRFINKVVVVTGAAQGIGKTVALSVIAEGGTLVAVDRSPLVSELCSALQADGHAAIAVEADLERYAECCRVMDEAIEAFGRIDVLINNVGGTIWVKPFEHYEEEQIEAEVRRSLFPTLWCCRAALPFMQQQGEGAIVNVSSVATRGLYRVPYSAAKGGVNAITTCLAFENGSTGIRVNGVAPGGTDVGERAIPRNTNPMSEQEKEWYQGIVDQTIDSTFLNRYGNTDEQAAAILFLASDEASYITGVTIPVAGGDLG